MSSLFAENIEHLKLILIDLINMLVAFLSAETSFFKDSVGAFQTVGMVLVMAMIPFGIAIVQELLSPDTRSRFPRLDLYVILSRVIPAKYILLIFALVFLSPIAWNISKMPNEFNWFFLVSWTIGIMGLLGMFANLFHWIRSDQKKWDLEMEYLEKLSNKKNTKEEKFIIWKDIFSKKRTWEEERELWIRFKKTLDNSWHHKEWKTDGENNEFIELLRSAIWQNKSAENGAWLLQKLDTDWSDNRYPREVLIWHLMRKVILGDAKFLEVEGWCFRNWLNEGKKKKDALESMLKMLNQLKSGGEVKGEELEKMEFNMIGPLDEKIKELEQQN